MYSREDGVPEMCLIKETDVTERDESVHLEKSRRKGLVNQVSSSSRE